MKFSAFPLRSGAVAAVFALSLALFAGCGGDPKAPEQDKPAQAATNAQAAPAATADNASKAAPYIRCAGESEFSIFVRGNGVRLRSTPSSTENNIVRVAQNDELFPGYGEATDAKGDTWYKICVDGKFVYIHRDFTELIMPEGE